MNNDHKNTNVYFEKIIKLYKVVGLILALISSGLTAITFSSCLDGYGYLAQTPLTVIWTIVIIASVLFAFSALFVIEKGSMLEFHRHRAGFFSALAIAGTVISLIKFKDDGVGVAPWLLIVCGIATILYFIFVEFQFSKCHELEICLGFVTVIFCALVVAEVYLDHSVRMNAPAKLLAQFAAASIMLNTLSDIRHKFSDGKDRVTVFTSIVTIILCASACVSGFFGLQTASDGAVSLLNAFSYFYIGYAIYATARLFSLRIRSGSFPEDNNVEIDLDASQEDAYYTPDSESEDK